MIKFQFMLILGFVLIFAGCKQFSEKVVDQSAGLNGGFEAGRFKGEGRYKLSFWIRNNGTKYSISAGGVSEKKGDMKTLLQGNEQIGDWQLFEYVIDIPKDTWLRMELNILQPGIFWIDDIKIEKI